MSCPQGQGSIGLLRSGERASGPLQTGPTHTADVQTRTASPASHTYVESGPVLSCGALLCLLANIFASLRPSIALGGSAWSHRCIPTRTHAYYGNAHATFVPTTSRYCVASRPLEPRNHVLPWLQSISDAGPQARLALHHRGLHHLLRRLQGADGCSAGTRVQGLAKEPLPCVCCCCCGCFSGPCQASCEAGQADQVRRKHGTDIAYSCDAQAPQARVTRCASSPPFERAGLEELAGSHNRASNVAEGNGRRQTHSGGAAEDPRGGVCI